ncbi:MAG: AMP-binding protein [Deltaproteobacteria bacterium]|nr:AMP-binding protein [Deltaproteobacteria bacterium]
MIFEQARARPGAVALDDLTCRRTWAELIDRSTRVAHLLRDEFGLRPNQHAAVLMGNRVEFIELVLGAMLAGIWLTPINRHLQAEEVAYIGADSGARVVFVDADHEAIARQTPTAAVVLAGDELDRALARVSDEPLSLAGPAGATMIYTSGTSGRPKGVKRARPATLGAALAAAAAAGRALGLDGSGPHLVTGPLYHAAPLLFAMYDQANGAPIVIMPRWDAEPTLHLIREREIRHTHMVPTMFVRLLRLDEAVQNQFDPSSLRVVLHGAAPIAPAVKRRMIEWWGKVLVEYWGATEGGVCTLVDSADWLAHPGTVGRPTANFEVFAAGDNGRRLPPDEIGVLYCRHRHLATVFEYHGAPEKTAASYLEPGVFTTGDIGRVDAAGYVYLTDRQSNLIIAGGVNIYPAEIEQVLQQHPAVADAAVFGIPDDEWGESVKAAVELAPGRQPSAALAAEILAFARQHLAAYKVPRSIDFEAELPRHPTGKLYTRRLRDRHWKGRERRI